MAPSCNGSIKIDGGIPSPMEKFCTALGWVSVTKVTQRTAKGQRQHICGKKEGAEPLSM
jgi:hypothetical protein